MKEGDHVKKGDLLLKINPNIYISNRERVAASLNTSKANLENIKARLTQVKAQFTNTEAGYNRSKKLFEQGTISQSDYDASKAAYESAKAEIEASEENVRASEFSVKSAEASLKEATDNLAKTEIYSPVNGTVSKLNVEKGERVVGTSQMNGTDLLTIANLNEMEVRVDVNENDIVRVHLSDTSVIEVDAYLDRKFKGIVTEIANSANTSGVSTDQVTNFTVKIRILQESYQDLMKEQNHSPFRPGMSATVDIQTKKVSGVISVPIQAVTTRKDSSEGGDRKEDMEDKQEEQDENKLVVKDTKEEASKKENKELKRQECVFVYENGKARFVKVKTGIQDNNYIEILSGLKENQEVISGPYSAVSKILKNGSAVKKVEKSHLFKTDMKSH